MQSLSAGPPLGPIIPDVLNTKPGSTSSIVAKPCCGLLGFRVQGFKDPGFGTMLATFWFRGLEI